MKLVHPTLSAKARKGWAPGEKVEVMFSSLDDRTEESGHCRLKGSDSPAGILIFVVIFAAFALCRPFASDSYLAKEGDLQTISGSVQRAPYVYHGSKGAAHLHILVRGSDGLYDLTQDDMDRGFPGIMSPIMDLRVGDKVTARVKHDSLGRNLEWLWELQRDGKTILSYQDTHRYLEHQNMRMRRLCSWAGGIAFLLFLIAVLLRMHFGAWTGNKRGGVIQRSFET
jgi:hypothetical protein